ncbi:MAG: hypothetical protein Q9211_001480 [Gyalolechia sp. 1 TL-2023]
MAHAEGLPRLEPAMRFLIEIAAPIAVGSASRGTPLSAVSMASGTAVSHPTFKPVFDAVFEGGGTDYIRNDPDGKHMRLDAHAVMRDKKLGSLVYVHYTGVIGITPELGLVLSGSPEAKSTEFGDAFIHLTFETGDEKLKELETGVFVASGRFVVEEGKPTTVEYRVSKVVV